MIENIEKENYDSNFISGADEKMLIPRAQSSQKRGGEVGVG